MRVLYRLADGKEQFESLPRRQLVLVAELGDRDSPDQLHHEVRPARRRGGAIEHLGDVWMIHDCQGLSLRLEASDDLSRVHAGFEDLQGHLAAYRLELFRHVNDAKPALADLLQKLVRTDDRARGLDDGRLIDGVAQRGSGGSMTDETANLLVFAQECGNLPEQI